jgi:magnesium transporter
LNDQTRQPLVAGFFLPGSGRLFASGHLLPWHIVTKPHVLEVTVSQTRPQTLQARLAPILALLHKHEIVESLTHRQGGAATPLVEQLVHRQHEAELARKIAGLLPADLAHLLEMVSGLKRQWLWQSIPDEAAAACLLELGEGSLLSVLQHTDSARLLRLLQWLDTDELSVIADYLEPAVLSAATAQLASQERRWLEDTLRYDEGSVGSLMSRDSLIFGNEERVDAVIAQIRALPELPDQIDTLFIVNAQRVLVGSLPLTALLRHDGDAPLKSIMDTEPASFSPQGSAKEAAYAFERYDLISAPVVDERGRILGRLTVETMMDFLRETREQSALATQGLSVRADLFDAVWAGAKARWLWLAINLVTAFVATRFIAAFASSIESLVALATLMPMVASLGGNAGQQTAALMVRSIALNHIHPENLRIALRKELAVSLINGAVWGSVLGALAAALYQNWGLGLVMLAAVMLNLLIAATAGIFTPLLVNRLGRDPAMGTSVILTFITDSMGFLIFLGLATAWLIP